MAQLEAPPRRSPPARATAKPSRRRPPTRHPRSGRRRARRHAPSRRGPAHGEWAPASDRRDPVELLEEQAASRVPELVPIRYGRMLVSPFTFFRGAAYPMAADLAGEPRTGLQVQLCGDAHLSNFGAFARARPAARVQHQRLRRDAAGPVRVGRQAAGGELRRRWPGPGVRREAAAARSTSPSRARTARRSGSSPGCPTSTSGTPASTSTRSPSWPLSTAPESSGSASSATWPRRGRRTA